jgi:membrane protease YdiL (CAAX protease family)
LFNAAQQEILTRGYVLQTIRDHFSVRSALWFSSLIFMLMHAGVLLDGAILPAINLFLAGRLFGIAYLYTGSLWLPIGLHFGWNYMIGPVLGLTLTGQNIKGQWQMLELSGPDWITGGEFGPEGGIMATVVVAAGILYLELLDRKRKRAIAAS